MRRCRKRTISLVCTGVCTVCTNSVFTFLNFPYTQFLVGVLRLLVQGLFQARFSREFA